MPSIIRANLRAIIAHAILAAVFCGGFYQIFLFPGQTGNEIASYRRELESRRPKLVLIGNSLLRAAVDDGEFSQLSGIPTLAAHCNGSSSLWWYLYVKNVIIPARHKPQFVGIMFRDTYLTEPAFRVDGNYQKPIRQLMTSHEPLVQDLSYRGTVLSDINSPLTWVPREARNWINYKIEKRVEDLLDLHRGQGREAMRRVLAADNMQSGAYTEFQLAYEETQTPQSFDFAERVDHSYLPHIVAMLREHDITPIFIRAKRRRDVEPDAEPAEVKSYVADLRQYLAGNGAVLFDCTHEGSITLAHFGPGDHLNHTTGRAQFMQLFARQMQPQVAALNDSRR